MMPVRLRGHHFLCILTYRGEGYTAPFVSSMSRIVESIASGAQVVLCEGPDEICGGFTAACRAVCDHDCDARETAKMDRQAADAVSALLGRPLETAAPLGVAEIAALRTAFSQKSIRAACADCSWKELCDDIAEGGFTGVLL